MGRLYQVFLFRLGLVLLAVASSTSQRCSNTYDCVCGHIDKKYLHHAFNGFVVCDIDQKQVYVDFLACVTYVSEVGFVAGTCPFSTVSPNTTHHGSRYLLPNKNITANTSFNSEVMCHPMRRHGRNCGSCDRSSAVAVDTYFLHCIPKDQCHPYNWALLFLSNLGPMTLFFIVIVVFHIRFSSGYANGYILFAQVVSMQINVMRLENDWLSVIQTNDTTLADRIVIPLISVYSIWNLDFGRCITPYLCLGNNVGHLHAFGFQCITAVYGIVLTITVYVLVELHAHNVRLVVWLWHPIGMCFSRFQRHLDTKASLIDAFATFFLLSYSKLALISIMLLVPTTLINSKGEMVQRVLLYDGTTDYFKGHHLPLAIIAVVVLVLFIALPPVLLILYPFKCVQRCLNRCQLNRPALVAFMDAFQGCYKDGTDDTRDLRFFSAIYLFVRMIVFTLYAVLAPMYLYPTLQFSMIFIILCIIVLLALLLPYKENIYNKIDIAMLAYLAVVIAACMYKWTLPHAGMGPDLPYQIIFHLLLLGPFLVAVCYVLFRLCMFVRIKRCIRLCGRLRHRNRPGQYYNSESVVPKVTSPSTTFPDRLLRPELYEDSELCFVANKTYGTV